MISLGQACVEFCTKCLTSADNPLHVCMFFMRLAKEYWGRGLYGEEGKFLVECG